MGSCNGGCGGLVGGLTVAVMSFLRSSMCVQLES
jgi:hypothetical protein